MKKITLLTVFISSVIIGLNAQQVKISANSGSPLNIEATGTTSNWIGFHNSNGYQGYAGLFTGLADMDFGTGGPNSTGKVHLVTSASPKLTVIPNGNVGIGVTDPDARLEVNGQLKITGGSPGTNKVLVSDANGLASWAASPPPPPTTYTIGDFAQGGVVFWVSPSGEHGKVVSIYDVNDVPWSNINGTAIGNSARSNINGGGNTVAIMMQSGHTNSAAKHCADLGYGGYDDWYLPSKDELNEVYQNRAAINTTATANGGEAFAADWYWSSTETNSTNAWLQYFGNGAQGYNSKNLNNRVRAVRAF